jgi:glutamate N-acetyltransferase/amino-acid N-acetyltransferase
MEWIGGGVCAPEGFQAAGVECGLKSAGLDLGLLGSPLGCTVAGMFTANTLPGWPVVLSREVVARSEPVAGVVANSGVSNVATGEEGLAVARAMSSLAAEAFRARWGAVPDSVLIAQTGVIGELPDIAKITAGVRAAGDALAADGGLAFAQAIMTTDTRPKSRAVRVATPSGAATIGGAAKGAGMIAPHMATMLAFLTTDARLTPDDAATLLRPAVEPTLNRITVDGDTSTSDSVFLLANGASGVAVAPGTPEGDAFAQGLLAICEAFALDLVGDAEGVKRVGKVVVTGAASAEEALIVARAIAESPLVKCALTGGDPNWGRIWMAVGKSGVSAAGERLSIAIAGVPVLARGTPVPGGKAAAAPAMQADEVLFEVDLAVGNACGHYWFSDLTREYVSINADYHT